MRTLLAAGAVAAALGSIVGLALTIRGLLDPPAKSAGTVEMKILSTTPLTFGDWLRSMPEPVLTDRFSAAQLKQPGRMIAFDVTTENFEVGVQLPLQLTLYGGPRPKPVPKGTLRVERAKSCGFREWVAIPPGRRQHTIQVDIYPPGRTGLALRTALSEPFQGS